MPHLGLTSRAVKHIAQKASRKAVVNSKALGLPVFFYDDVLGLDVMEDADGNQFEIFSAPDGDYTLLGRLPYSIHNLV